MFGWFHNKVPESAMPYAEPDGAAMLALPNPAFTDLCVKMIQGEQPGAKALVVVAFNVVSILLPLSACALKLEGKDHQTDVLRTLFDGFMSMPNDELNRRRREAFLRAWLFHELIRREETDLTLHKIVVDIWVDLAGSCQYLPNLLEHNIVWSDEEKSWLKDFKTGDEAVSKIVNILIPARYRADPKFEELGKKHSFFVVPIDWDKPDASASNDELISALRKPFR
jgi:hypothetical protein